MIEQPDLKTVRVNLSGKRFTTALTLFCRAFHMLFTGKTFIRIKTQLPS